MSELPPGGEGFPPSTNAPALSYGPTMPFALWGDRVLAALIDGGIVMGIVGLLFVGVMLLSLVFTGLSIAAENASRGSSGAFGSLPCCLCCGAPFIAAIVGFLFGLYNKVYLVGKRGYSIGQGFRHLRVVMKDGSAAPLGTLILRLLVQCLFGILWFVQVLNLLWPLWDPQRQTLHDKAVGTFVIQVAG